MSLLLAEMSQILGSDFFLGRILGVISGGSQGPKKEAESAIFHGFGTKSGSGQIPLETLILVYYVRIDPHIGILASKLDFGVNF